MKWFLPTIKDSRGEESVTLLFVFVSWLVTTFKYILSGFTFKFTPASNVVIEYAAIAMAPMEYGSTFALIIGIWLAREYRSRSTGKAGS